MKIQESDQGSKSRNNAKNRKSTPSHTAASDREEEIRQGANEADQLIKQKPQKEDVKSAEQLGKTPKHKINKGE